MVRHHVLAHGASRDGDTGGDRRAVIPFRTLAVELLAIDASTVGDWLVEFLRDTCTRQRRVKHVTIGLSGGVDSAVSAALCVRAFGAQNVHCFAMPYRLSSHASLDDARLVASSLGLELEAIEITAMVDGYAASQSDLSPARLGNICPS